MENEGNHHNPLLHDREEASKGECFILLMYGFQLWFSSDALVEAALGLWTPALGSVSPLIRHVSWNKSLSLSGPLILHLHKGRPGLTNC